MKIACVGYRKWALNIYEDIMNLKGHSFLLIKSEESFDEKKIVDFSPDLILFYGWSKKISNNIINNFKCLMLHPSSLPLFRGGSPIQNQIIRGIKDSKVSIFLISEKIDAGDIFCQEYLDLRGSINDIFLRL